MSTYVKTKVKNLQSDLESLDVFSSPKLHLEQYHTPPGVAANMLHAINLDKGLSDKTVLDLGCGCGILGLGCVNCGAAKVLGVDLDNAALLIAEQNREDVGLASDNIHFLEFDVLKLRKEDVPVHFRQVDICVSNPPFGTRTKNLDFYFVRKGLEFSDVMYSIHKSSTREFFLKKAKDMDVSVNFLFENLDFPIAQTYSFHKSKERCIKIDIVRFERK